MRKLMLVKYSYGFICTPGGYGTLDELFEVATLIQTHKIESFPVVLLGSDYWSPLIAFLRHPMLSSAAIDAADLDEILITDSLEEAVAHIQREATTRFGLKYTPRSPKKFLFERGI